ncbi:MAG: PUA domain-containing protein [Candidatus Woesearchaeota archaeon]
MGQLPFETSKPEVLARRKASPSDKYGEDPWKRPVKELLDYGIVNVDKPSGPSSHQVSAYVQQILGIEKSGHSGTLDPKVTGCLPVALGRGTRVVQSLLIAGKEYVGIMHLHKEVAKKDLMKVVEKFTGNIMQLPPVKSAVKRQIRERKIYYLEILDVQKQDVLFRAGTQAGTYIRKLCLSPSTEIVARTGQVTAKDFYTRPVAIYTMNSGKIVVAKPTAVQRILGPETLLELKTSSGIKLVVTPDHELLRSGLNGYVMTAAERFKPGDFIVKSAEFPVPTKRYVVADLLDDKYLVNQPEITQKCKEAFVQRYGSIRGMYRVLGLDRKAFLTRSSYAIPIGHLKAAGIYNHVKGQLHCFKTQKGKVIDCKSITPEISYILGLVASDGNNTKEGGTVRHTRIKFHNKELALIDAFVRIHKSLFPNVPVRLHAMRPGLFEVDVSNSFLATIAASLGISSPQKERNDLLPILFFDNQNLQAFLKGYFDGDGTAIYRPVKTRTYCQIAYYTISEITAKRLHQMLLKLGISSKIFQNQADLFAISLDSLVSQHKFIDAIGTNHPRKQAVFEKIRARPSQGDRRYMGLHVKKYLKPFAGVLRKYLGGNFDRVVNGNVPCTRAFYAHASTLVNLPKPDLFVIEKITRIRRLPGEAFVYDMTVPKTHNFLIETGYVSSNCHDIGKELGGGHMTELRRTKVGPFQEDSLVTLQFLRDALHFWKEEGREDMIRKAILPIETAVSHLPKVWALDSSVDALCHGASLKTPGVAKVTSGIEPGKYIAVMSMRDELIFVGQAAMLSEKMLTAERGIAVKPSQVFMRAGLYPKQERA